jgi:hypothetical protein
MTAAAPLARKKPDRRRRGLRGKLNASPELPDIPGVSLARPCGPCRLISIANSF